MNDKPSILNQSSMSFAGRVSHVLTAWGRLLLVGLLASILLHGIALDLWRSSLGWRSAHSLGLERRVLQARLRIEASESRAGEASLQRFIAAQAVTPPSKDETVRAPGGTSVATGQLLRELPTAVAPRPSTEQSEQGLRPLSRAEGLVAYRLALLEALEPGLTLPGSLRFGLVTGLSSHSVQVVTRTSSGDPLVDQQWLGVVQRAVERAELPSVLAGQAFELELEFLP
jgi:hypothetical protein